MFLLMLMKKSGAVFHLTTHFPELRSKMKALQQISGATNVDGDLFEKT